MPADITAFNPRALVLSRGVREMTQTQLAEAVGVTQPAVSQWEKGLRGPDADTLVRLADVLGVLPSMLTDDTTATTTPMFRAGALDSKRAERRVEGRIEQARIAVARILAEVDFGASLPWPSTDDPLPHDPIEAAEALRRVWRIPSGPLTQLVKYIEAAGTVVVRAALGHDKVEAAYAHPRRDARRWILLNTETTDGARDRLTVAHELGHALLHHWDAFNVPEEREREAQAFAFSIALLVPADEFIADVVHMRRRWDDFLRLRPKWGVSAAALARRAHQLGLINQDAYRRLNMERRRRGHWANEPGAVELEEPTIFSSTVRALRSQAGWTIDDFAEVAGLPPDRLRDLLPQQFADEGPPAVTLRLLR